jgi:hypothetical protein
MRRQVAAMKAHRHRALPIVTAAATLAKGNSLIKFIYYTLQARS